MELRDYARGLRRHWLAIVLMILVGAGVAFGWAKLQTPVYEADASGIIKSTAAPTDPQQESLIGVNDAVAQQKVPAYKDLAGYRDVAQYVIDDLKLATTPEELVTHIVVDNPTGTAILKISAQAQSPAAARALAESWIRGMSSTIDKLYGTSGKAGSAPVNIYPADSASLPSSPVFPDLRTSLLVGAIIGLGFGVAFALMRTASDRRIRAADEVEQKTEVAVVGTIPLVKQADTEMRLFDPEASRDGPGFAVAEAIRTLRTNLQFMDVDNPPRTIVITSPLPGDGKSTIACNLALTLAAGGTRVVLVDGDLRRSKVANTMGVSPSAGLSDVLAGRADLFDVMQRAPQSENLTVLAAGATPPNPSEVLGSARMRVLLEELSENATVIIDAPPLIPVTDGAVLTHQADGALIVIGVGKTTYDLLEKALDTLRKARGRALGVVLNKVPLKGADASPYSYVYQREYADQNPVRRATQEDEEIPVTATAVVSGTVSSVPVVDSADRRTGSTAAVAPEPVPAPEPEQPFSVIRGGTRVEPDHVAHALVTPPPPVEIGPLIRGPQATNPAGVEDADEESRDAVAAVDSASQDHEPVNDAPPAASEADASEGSAEPEYGDDAMNAFEDSLSAFEALLHPDVDEPATNGAITPRRRHGRRG